MKKTRKCKESVCCDGQSCTGVRHWLLMDLARHPVTIRSITTLRLGKQLLHHPALYVGQSEVAAGVPVGQSFVIQTE